MHGVRREGQGMFEGWIEVTIAEDFIVLGVKKVPIYVFWGDWTR